MVKITKITNLSMTMNSSIKSMTDDFVRDANIRLKSAVTETFGDIIEQTPIGINETAGKTRGSWFLSRRKTERIGRKNKSKGRGYIKKALPRKIFGKRFFLYNNSPHINTLEFGGYVKNPKRGTYNKSTRRYEIRSKDGFSKQAPAGMVRKNVRRFPLNLRRAFNG